MTDPTAMSPREWPGLRASERWSGFDQPVGLTSGRDGSGRLYVCERPGRVRLIEDENVRERPFLDITDRVGMNHTEQGLMSIAFPPAYAGKGYFYVCYTAHNNDVIVSRFRLRGEEPEPGSRDSVAAIHMATTYFLGTSEEGAAITRGDMPGYIYNRWGHPNQAHLEEKVAVLNGAEAALACATGMGAISTALLSVLKAGDHVVCADCVYSGTFNLMSTELPALGIQTTILDATDPQRVRDALRPNPLRVRLGYLLNPPGWSPDGSSHTAKEMRAARAGLTCCGDTLRRCRGAACNAGWHGRRTSAMHRRPASSSRSRKSRSFQRMQKSSAGKTWHCSRDSWAC